MIKYLFLGALPLGALLSIGSVLFFFKKVFDDSFKIIITLVLSALVGIFFNVEISLFGFTYTVFASKLLLIGLIFTIDLLMSQMYLLYNIVVPIILICIIFFFTNGTLYNHIVFKNMTENVSTHFFNKKASSEAKELDFYSELDLCLKELEKSKKDITKENINDIITQRNYRSYNGINCFAVKKDGENYEVGLNIVSRYTTLKFQTKVGETKAYLVSNDYKIIQEIK